VQHKNFDLPKTKKQIEESDLPLDIKQAWILEVKSFENQSFSEQSYWQVMKKKLKEKNANKIQFAKKTLLDERYYDRAINDEKRQIPELRTVVAIAAGYDFDLPFTKKLLELVGMAFNPTDPVHRAYEFILRAMPGYTIDEKNEILIASGFPILGTERVDKP